MSANLVSHINITTKGNGYRTPETLPKTSARNNCACKDAIAMKNNCKYYCSNCGTKLPTITKKDITEESTCPFCHAKKSFRTIKYHLAPKNISKHFLDLDLNEFQNNIKNEIALNPNSTVKSLANRFNLSYNNMYYYVKVFNIPIKKRKYKCK